MNFFGRYAEIYTGGMTLTSEELDIEFTVPFDSDTEPNESEIKVYNLTDTTVNRFKQKQKLVLNAGYKGDIGVVLSGYISKTKTERQGVDKVTTIFVLDSQPLNAQKTLNKTYKKNIKASQVIRDLLARLKIDVTMKLVKDKTFPKGYTIDGEIIMAIASLAKDCGATFFMNKGKAYIRPIHSGEAAKFILNETSGLVGSPAPFEDESLSGYTVTSLLQYRITTADAISLESLVAKGKFYVYAGKHRWSGSEFVTEIDLIR